MWTMGWETSISDVYGAFTWRTYMEGSLLNPLGGSATPGQGNRSSATTKALNHTGRTFQRIGSLENASIEVWGMQKKAPRRKGTSMGL